MHCLPLGCVEANRGENRASLEFDWRPRSQLVVLDQYVRGIIGGPQKEFCQLLEHRHLIGLRQTRSCSSPCSSLYPASRLFRGAVPSVFN